MSFRLTIPSPTTTTKHNSHDNLRDDHGISKWEVVINRSYSRSIDITSWAFEPLTLHSSSAKMHFSTPRSRLRSAGDITTTICALLLLIALPSVAVADKSAGDYFVHSLPGAPDGHLLKMHAGYVSAERLSDCLCTIANSELLASSKSTQNTMAIYSFGISRIDILRTGNGQ